MKKTSLLLALILVFAMFYGCTAAPAEESPAAETEGISPAPESPATENESFTLATLKGATTMGLVKLLDDASSGALDYTVENTIYGTADEVTALIIGGKVDMAAIPANVASVLYAKTGGKIQVAAINTLGVLSVLELGDSINAISDLKGKTIYSTGKGTTPEFALNAILRANGLDPEKDLTIEYKSEATEIASLLSGDSAADGAIAVLPQPYATTVIMQNAAVRVALDLTDEWTKADLDGSLVTGVLVINREFAEGHPELVGAFLKDYAESVNWVNTNNPEAAELIADIGIVAKAPVAQAALPYCNIVFIEGSQMKTALSAYLKVLYEQQPSSVGGELPDEGFYYNAQ